MVECSYQFIGEDNLEYLLKVLDNMSDVTVENSIDGIADFKLSQGIHTPDTVVYFFHGTAINEMLAKESAKFVKKHYPNTTVKCFKGKFHCENALFHPEIMIEELDKIFDKQRYEFEFGGGLDDENRKPYVGSNRY